MKKKVYSIVSSITIMPFKSEYSAPTGSSGFFLLINSIFISSGTATVEKSLADLGAVFKLVILVFDYSRATIRHRAIRPMGKNFLFNACQSVFATWWLIIHTCHRHFTSALNPGVFFTLVWFSLHALGGMAIRTFCSNQMTIFLIQTIGWETLII